MQAQQARLNYSKHALDRMQDRKIPEKAVLYAIQNGKTKRGAKIDTNETIANINGHTDLHVVWSDRTNQILTVWARGKLDNGHK